MIKKFFILCSILMLITPEVLAAEWIRLNVTNTEKYIYLDHDSIYKNGDYLYYIVRYKDNDQNEHLAYIKYNSQNDKLGIMKIKNFEDNNYVTPSVWQDSYAFMKKVEDNSLFKNINNYVTDDKMIHKLLVTKEQRTKNATLNNSDLINKYFVKHPEMKTYIVNVQNKIRQNWEPPVTNNGGVAKVLFKINRDGNLTSCEIKESSGNDNNDTRAINAVKMTAPFDKFPDIVDKELKEIPIIMSFNYFVLDVNKK